MENSFAGEVPYLYATHEEIMQTINRDNARLCGLQESYEASLPKQYKPKTKQEPAEA